MNTKQGVDKCAKIVEEKMESGAKIGSDSTIEGQSIVDERISTFVSRNDADVRNDGFEVVWC